MMYILEDWIQENPDKAAHYLYIYSYNGTVMSVDKIPRILLSAHILVDDLHFIVKIL